MPDKQTKKRKPPISYRPPEALRAEFERFVVESGLSANAFLNECVFGRNRHRSAEIKLLAEKLVLCAEITDWTHENKRSDRAASYGHLLEAILSQLIEIRSALFLLMGRKP